MGNPNVSQQAPPSITSVLKEISDDKSYLLFNNIAASRNNDRFIPLKEMNLSSRQYYSKISGLLEAGLIKRHKSTYSLTLLGKVVYDLQMTIAEALLHYWKIKAIDTIEKSDSNLTKEEKTQLINALIDNHRIKDILMNPTDVTCDDAKSKIRISTHTQHQSMQNQKGLDRVT